MFRTAEEGFSIVGDRVAGGAKFVAAAQKKTAIKWVAVPEPWTGDGAIDACSAEDFLALLDERTVSVEE